MLFTPLHTKEGEHVTGNIQVLKREVSQARDSCASRQATNKPCLLINMMRLQFEHEVVGEEDPSAAYRAHIATSGRE